MLWHYYAIPLLLLTSTLKQSAGQDESGGIEYGNGMYEGDIKLTDEQEQSFEALSNSRDPNAPQNAVVRNERQLWPEAVVPYFLDGSLNSRARTAIAEAVADYARLTCINFVERTNEVDYVRIFPGGGCFSYIGRTTGPQDMSIGRGCEYKGIVMHEMFHALGRWHEQSRPDRDQFVRILTDNIQSGTENNFDVTNPAFVTTQGIPYDIGSVMHYSSNAFSRNGRPTILPIDRDISPSSLGQRRGLSERDIQHVQTLYCGGGGVSGGSWSSWARFSRCSRTCNGGTRSRTRTCVGGTDCDGSNVDTQRCNTNSCPVVASWGSWSRWSGCSNTCGGGRQTRTRRCVRGNNCVGRETQFQDCSTQNCPITASWASWGSWSSCSSTCQGGFQQRRRFCRNGKNCPGTDVQSAYCNKDIPCQPNPNNGEWSSWSTCSADCGGGSRFRTRYCEDSQSKCVTEVEDCNEADCVPEPELRGLNYRGCWYLNTRARKIGSFEKTTPDLSDDATTRVRPVSKCGKAVQEEGYEYFGVATGYCLSGSNDLDDYQYYASSLCRNGRGAYTRKYGGWFLMDVYEIYNTASFSDSLIQLSGGNITTTDMMMTTTDMTMTTTGSGYALTYNLVLLVSSILTAVLSMAVM